VQGKEGKGASNFIANIACTFQPNVLSVLFMINEPSASTNPVTQLGLRITVILSSSCKQPIKNRRFFKVLGYPVADGNTLITSELCGPILLDVLILVLSRLQKKK